jgi:hypothetical protein
MSTPDTNNFLESEIALKNDIYDYIRLRLADGMVEVELDKEHYELALKQAFIKYRQKAQNAVEESYCFLDLVKETQEYILPKEIVEVRQVFRRGIGSVTGTTASQFEPFASGYLNTYMLQAGRVGGLANYEMFASYQKLAMTMFGGHIQYIFDRSTKKLTIIRKIPESGESVLLWVYCTKPDSVLLNDHMIYPWLQEYAYSFAKGMLGQAYEKFSTIAGPQGGASLNGASLKAESKEEMIKLETDLKEYVTGAQPITWITG